MTPLNCQSSFSECCDASEDDSIRIASSFLSESFDTILGPSSSLQVGKIVIFSGSGALGAFRVQNQFEAALKRSGANVMY